ncbi:protein daughter of sevenless-like isoform X2 [Copidosoma floridanum]|uniref:protein daughter of sevenless-like isoform X2 n=1 Tax=Copidosoma floridanum TaxID=29053 RepID=UPI0006C96E8E|nr:protein daughter of sevenless-like isoform X2 [Copidosoma floridanum]
MKHLILGCHLPDIVSSNTIKMLKTNQEIVHEGWLIKSPPESLWKARWMKRWFTLRQSGELPGQYILEYYEGNSKKKLKGQIDLDQCTEVDSGLQHQHKKRIYAHVFKLKTPKRTYYLAADNEADMNKWVHIVCQVCGMKESDGEQRSRVITFDPQESPPISPASSYTSPYIHISDCVSGRSLNFNRLNPVNSSQFQGYYSAPRRYAQSPPRSPTTTDADSATDDDSIVHTPSVNSAIFLSSSKNSLNSAHEADIQPRTIQTKRLAKLDINDSSVVQPLSEVNMAPPRPPKPTHMKLENHNYLNLDGVTESTKPTTPVTPVTPVPQTPFSVGITDETYDFPRSHQPGVVDATNSMSYRSRHCYSNAAPVSAGAIGKDERVFRFDSLPSSPRVPYSNLSSPRVRSDTSTMASVSGSQSHLASAVPVVCRKMKPGRRTSDTLSMTSNEFSPGPMSIGLTNSGSSAEPSPTGPPSVNRNLKPSPQSRQNYEMTVPLKLDLPPVRGKARAAPSPTPPGESKSRYATSCDNITYFQDHQLYIPPHYPQEIAKKEITMQYLDLDLKVTGSTSAPPIQPPSSTDYKSVDFDKTYAFNRTRKQVEEKRKQCTKDFTIFSNK